MFQAAIGFIFKSTLGTSATNAEIYDSWHKVQEWLDKQEKEFEVSAIDRTNAQLPDRPVASTFLRN
jgi:hypothetical protein